MSQVYFVFVFVYERETGVGLHRYDVSLPAEGLDFDVAVNSLSEIVPFPALELGVGEDRGVKSAAQRGIMEDVGH